MKKYIPLFLITSLLLSACGIDWNDEKDTKIAELEKQVQDDTFQKKQECQKYKNDIEKWINEKIQENKKSSAYIYYNKTLGEIFYSKNKKTCIALIGEMYQYQSKNNIANNMQEYDTILDILNNDLTSYSLKDKSMYYDKIKELKWENVTDVDKEYENYLKVINKS